MPLIPPHKFYQDVKVEILYRNLNLFGNKELMSICCECIEQFLIVTQSNYKIPQLYSFTELKYQNLEDIDPKEVNPMC